MPLDYYFPLLTDVLYGDLRPDRPENADQTNYAARIEAQIRPGVHRSGVYNLTFLNPHNLKCTYYLRLLIGETYLYCEEMLAHIATENDPCIRSYLRDSIIDKHLRTSLMKIGDVIRANNYRLDEVISPATDADSERLSSVYIFHLLKVCVAKAYLEIQSALADVVDFPIKEELLYTSFVRDFPPVKRFVHKLNSSVTTTAIAEEMPKKSTGSTSSDTKETPSYSVKAAVALLNCSEKTILRKIASGEIKAEKEDGRYWIDKEAFNIYVSKKKK